MRKPRRVLLVLAAVAGFAASLLTPTAAQAAYYGDETNYATSYGPPPNRDYCAWPHPGVETCFIQDGDWIYVLDSRADGYAAVGEWDYRADNGSARSGACVNKLGAGHWGRCNKDFAEDGYGYLNGARYNSGNPVDDGSPTWFTAGGV
jgi:hypothetical protein